MVAGGGCGISFFINLLYMYHAYAICANPYIQVISVYFYTLPCRISALLSGDRWKRSLSQNWISAEFLLNLRYDAQCIKSI